MKAILLAAGFGTRLRPLTEDIPKCLVPIKGKPLLEIWLENLQKAGIGPFLINTHYLPEKVTTFIENSPFRNNVTIVNETVLEGTAGTLIRNMDFYESGDGLLIHADNYCLADFRKFLAAHNARPVGCLMTVMAFRSKEPSKCGIFELDENNIVIGFHEKVANPTGNLANGAIYILSAEMLNILSADMNGVTDFSNEVMPKFIGRIYCYETNNTFIDIGTLENYAEANGGVLK
jgi:mannose-1-phosphate guanylyltransferase